MNVLYLGEDRGTSRHRIRALGRIGCAVEAIDPAAGLGPSRWVQRWIWHGGGRGLETLAARRVLAALRRDRYDLCVVNHGELVGPALLAALRARVGGVLGFNLDNPFARRDGVRWRIHRKAMPWFDLYATPRAATAQEGERRGFRMHRFVQAADEVVHCPNAYCAADHARFASDVAFVGTWFPERGPLVCRLLEAGVRVRLFGANWHKAPEYPRLAGAIAIPHMLDDALYPRAIQYARIALGFVSEGNDDQHTSRSVEVPALGTLLCARRTAEHRQMYREDAEAVFWDSGAECAAKCRALLAAPDRLAAIAAAGAARQRASANWNEVLMHRLIDATLTAARRPGAKVTGSP
jgi:hypothetical protein